VLRHASALDSCDRVVQSSQEAGLLNRRPVLCKALDEGRAVLEKHPFQRFQFQPYLAERSMKLVCLRVVHARYYSSNLANSRVTLVTNKSLYRGTSETTAG
jgi:hypothetical protein